MVLFTVVLVLVTMVYFVPYCVQKTHVSCGCGCGETSCPSCGIVRDCGNSLAWKKCHCDIHDDVYEPFPTLASVPFKSLDLLYPSGWVVFGNIKSALPEFRDPPMKPPPLNS
jgi:hypothetical protein